MKTKFKVGESYKWTIDLIKQLPHGTVLSCAYNGDRFTYNGEVIKMSRLGAISIETTDTMYFYSAAKKRYAKIISLPTEQTEDFKQGDEVEGSDNKKYYALARFTGGITKNGNYICEYENGDLVEYEEIRKPLNKDKEKAKEFLSVIEFSDDELERLCQNAVINGIKYGRENK